MRSLALYTVCLTLLLAPLHFRAEVAADAQPEQSRLVAILELFTSEGCSSCPPADALLQQIHLKPAPSGQLVVGLSEHVTYWNHLGWKDPYSEQIFTDRQAIYASRLSPQGPYTPQMVLNGRDQFVGSNRSALEQALGDDSHRKHAYLKIVSSVRHADGVDLRFALTGAASEPLEIIAVLTDDLEQSNVLGGENLGSSLKHVSVARNLSRIATVVGNTEQTAHLSLPESFQHGVSSGHHLVLFAQQPHQGAIVGAATLPL